MAAAKAKKDFSTANINPVYNAIAEATATEEVQEVQEVHEERKMRKTYTEEETQEFLSSLKTAGRKGVKLPRINLAFSPEIYDYVRTMSKVSGITLTEFVNKVLMQSLEENRDIYNKALEFRNSFNK